MATYNHPMPSHATIYQTSEDADLVALTRHAAPKLDRFTFEASISGSAYEIRDALTKALRALEAAEDETPEDHRLHCYTCGRDWMLRTHRTHDFGLPDECPECNNAHTVKRIAEMRAHGEKVPCYLLDDEGNARKSAYTDRFYFVPSEDED